jgi:hypothetical protein
MLVKLYKRAGYISVPSCSPSTASASRPSNDRGGAASGQRRVYSLRVARRRSSRCVLENSVRPLTPPVLKKSRSAQSVQCSTFTGMIPVFGVLLILFEWYWYVVCESGIRTSLILAQGNRWKCTAKAKHDWRSYVFRSQRSAVFTSAHSPQAPSRATQPTSQLAAAS